MTNRRDFIKVAAALPLMGAAWGSAEGYDGKGPGYVVKTTPRDGTSVVHWLDSQHSAPDWPYRDLVYGGIGMPSEGWSRPRCIHCPHWLSWGVTIGLEWLKRPYDGTWWRELGGKFWINSLNITPPLRAGRYDLDLPVRALTSGGLTELKLTTRTWCSDGKATATCSPIMYTLGNVKLTKWQKYERSPTQEESQRRMDRALAVPDSTRGPIGPKSSCPLGPVGPPWACFTGAEGTFDSIKVHQLTLEGGRTDLQFAAPGEPSSCLGGVAQFKEVPPLS